MKDHRNNNIIHERHTKSGKPNRDYIQGRFLGKVPFLFNEIILCKGWFC